MQRENPVKKGPFLVIEYRSPQSFLHDRLTSEFDPILLMPTPVEWHDIIVAFGDHLEEKNR